MENACPLRTISQGAVLGVGIDLTDVRHVGDWLRRFSNRALQLVFAAEELATVERAPDSELTLGICFAAKEAVGKALGTGLAGIEWSEIVAIPGERAIDIRLAGEAPRAVGEALGARRWIGTWTRRGPLVRIVVAALGSDTGRHVLQVAEVDLARVERAARRNGRELARRLLSDREIAGLGERENQLPALAARIAAKQAVGAILGRSVLATRRNVEIIPRAGAPCLRLQGRLQDDAVRSGLATWHVSLTHQGPLAAAAVVANLAA